MLAVANYVGVIETPCGSQIEILPKYTEGFEDAQAARRLLVRMISAAMDLAPRVAGVAEIQAFRHPMTEWLAARFLAEASALAKRGLRRAYANVEERQPFLRGQLDMARQLRAGPGRSHVFEIRHDTFVFDRPENRLIRTAVEQVLAATKSPDNWRSARELSLLLNEVPESRNVASDLRCWSSDRSLADYKAIRPWCELIVTRHTPFAVAGKSLGLSMLFPMERLFERYVLASLRRDFGPPFAVQSQVSTMDLCKYRDHSWFLLKPDFVIERGQDRWVLDAKWKLLSDNAAERYGLAQSDFYQLFAYGEKYLGGVGNLFLIYPMTAKFAQPRGPFVLSDTMQLHVVPFDLEAGRAVINLDFAAPARIEIRAAG